MMTTELATNGGHALAQTTPTAMPLADIRQWAEVFLASKLFKDTSDMAKAVVKIQYGQEIGVGPFAAMDGIDIIDGRPAPNAGLIAALIKRSGRYNFRVLESSPTGCRLQFTDRGETMGDVGFTVEDAKRAGLTGKQNWTKWPEDMMFARALTRGARRFCADVFMGSVYTPEELAPDMATANPVTGEVLDASVRQLPAATEPPAAPVLTAADPAYWERQYQRCASLDNIDAVDQALDAKGNGCAGHPLVQDARRLAVEQIAAAEWDDDDVDIDDALDLTGAEAIAEGM